MSALTYTASLERIVRKSIANGRIEKDLFRIAKGAGVDFNETVDHIVAEINANRQAA